MSSILGMVWSIDSAGVASGGLSTSDVKVELIRWPSMKNITVETTGTGFRFGDGTDRFVWAGEYFIRVTPPPGKVVVTVTGSKVAFDPATNMTTKRFTIGDGQNLEGFNIGLRDRVATDPPLAVAPMATATIDLNASTVTITPPPNPDIATSDTVLLDAYRDWYKNSYEASFLSTGYANALMPALPTKMVLSTPFLPSGVPTPLPPPPPPDGGSIMPPTLPPAGAISSPVVSPPPPPSLFPGDADLGAAYRTWYGMVSSQVVSWLTNPPPPSPMADDMMLGSAYRYWYSQIYP